jgi:hypothetical protein
MRAAAEPVFAEGSEIVVECCCNRLGGRLPVYHAEQISGGADIGLGR